MRHVLRHMETSESFFMLQIKFRFGFWASDVMAVSTFFENAHKSADSCIIEFIMKYCGFMELRALF